MNIFNLESEAPLSPRRRNLFAFTVLLIIILSIYSNTFDASWQFDDGPNIEDRGAVHLTQFTWSEIKKTFYFGKDEMGVLPSDTLYRPVANFTFALNYYFGRLDVFGYHLVNVSVHLVASMFLFLLIYHTLNLPILRARYGSGSYFIALLATVFWAINPVQIQAITYIVQRMASMSAMFYVMAMYFFLKARVSQGRSRKGLFFFMCVFSGLLSVGSKENAVMLPFSILIFDLFFIQGLTRENIRKSVRILLLLIIIPPIFAFLLKGPSVFDPAHILEQYELTRPFTLMERLLTEPRVILFYISLLFYPMPQRLSICHDIPISHSLIDPLTTIIAILAILGVLGLCIIKARQWPFITYCIIFFFLNHLIEGSFFGLELMFEHRNYLPSMLLFAPLAVLFAKAIGFYCNKRTMQVILSGFLVLLLVGFGHSTFMRNYTWETERSLWADAAEKAPDHIRPHMNLGYVFSEYKMNEKALSEFTAAASRKNTCNITDKGTLLFNLGAVHHRMGNLDLALEYYHKAERATFSVSGSRHNNIGMILEIKGQTKEAKQEYLKAILDPMTNVQPFRNLSLMLLEESQVKAAARYLQLALKNWPNDMAVLALLGYAHRFMGAFGEAFLLLERALAIEPHDAKIHLYISEIYFKRGMDKAAMKEILQFIKRENPNDLSIYIKGIAKEDNNDVIKPFKKRVMKELALAYEKRADAQMAKTKRLKGGIAALHKRPGEEKSLSPMDLKQETRDKAEDGEVMDGPRMVPAAR